MDTSLSRRLIMSLSVALLSVVCVFAQTNCPEFMREALSAVDGHCNALGRNQACYGYEQVEAHFLVPVADNFFTQASDIAPVADIQTIRTVPFNAGLGLWGVAVMNIQADLPNTIPGQNVTFVLLGDVEVENAVAPETAFIPSDGLEFVINAPAGANVRSGPGVDFNVVGGLPHNETVLADGLSEDGQWLRIAYLERPAWVSMTVIDAANPAINNLPVLSPDLYTPMQAFYLRTGMGIPECSDVPENILLVQGPENIEITISVNGANIRLGSSGALQVVNRDGAPYLRLVVFDGHFELGGQTVTTGHQSFLCLGDENSRGLDAQSNDLVVTCGASEPERIDPDEFGEVWCSLESIPASLLNYGIEVLCPGETPPVAFGGGATRSRIAGVNCSGLSFLTSHIPATPFTLSWSPASGADSYEVAVFDNTGYQTSVYGGITETSINLNGGDGFASVGYIDLRAYRNGEYACYLRMNFNRTGDPNTGGGYAGGGNGSSNGGSSGGTASSLSASLSCNKAKHWEATISYSGGGGATITASVTLDYHGDPGSSSSTADSGTFFFSDKRGVSNIVVRSSTGGQVNLGSCN